MTKKLSWDNEKDKLYIIKKYLPNAIQSLKDEGVILADICDAFDDWIPWLISRVEQLEAELKLTDDLVMMKIDKE